MYLDPQHWYLKYLSGSRYKTALVKWKIPVRYLLLYKIAPLASNYSGSETLPAFLMILTGSGSTWIRNFHLDPDPKLQFRIRIQKKVKEQINKNLFQILGRKFWTVCTVGRRTVI